MFSNLTESFDCAVIHKNVERYVEHMCLKVLDSSSDDAAFQLEWTLNGLVRQGDTADIHNGPGRAIK